eukprot:SAG22_NODE_8106_length_682_cov_1.102916_2_plen_96_part_00
MVTAVDWEHMLVTVRPAAAPGSRGVAAGGAHCMESDSLAPAGTKACKRNRTSGGGGGYSGGGYNSRYTPKPVTHAVGKPALGVGACGLKNLGNTW